MKFFDFSVRKSIFTTATLRTPSIWIFATVIEACDKLKEDRLIEGSDDRGRERIERHCCGRTHREVGHIREKW